MPAMMRKLGRLVPPLRRLHDVALQAQVDRDEAARHIAALRDAAQMWDLELAGLRDAAQKQDEEISALRDLGRARDLELAGLRDALKEAQQGHRAATGEVGALTSRLQRAEEDAARTGQALAHWNYLKSRNQLIELDFGVRPRVRYGHGQPVDPLMQAKLAAVSGRVGETMDRLSPLLKPMLTIPSHPVDDAAEPNWINLAFPALDAMTLYGMIADRKPRRFVEIGSGFSTKFARRAIRDHGLDTRIVSIDPQPRAEIDAICDEVMRLPLEEVPLSFFEALTPDDLVFFDGSHRAFQNSDVSVFFTELLPRLPSGLMFGVHDIFSPADYPPEWLEWYFSEQYLLTCWLLAGDKLQIEIPAAFISETPELHARFAFFWSSPALAGANHKGGAFFCTIT